MVVIRKYFADKEGLSQNKNNTNIHISESVLELLKDRLNESLSTFSNQPEVWVDPILCESENHDNESVKHDKIEVKIDGLVKHPYSVIIKAPPQFGLTCLSHHLIIEAWNSNSLWVYLDMNKINIQIDIEKIIQQELKKLKLKNRAIDCIVLDSWKISLIGSMKVLRSICNAFKDTPLIIMHTTGDFKLNSEQDIKINREFRELTLSALSRNSIRKIVSDYNNKINIGDENIILNKIVKDMEVLNVHRTPLNCITLLKTSEKHFDESPINRTKMIEMFLFVLFDLIELPIYKTKPDVKDCELVLGNFCEQMIKERTYNFSKDEFIKKLNTFCEENFLDLEIIVVFNVLLENRIIVDYNGKFRFKANYWISLLSR